MTNLRSLNLPFSINTSSHNIIQKFFILALEVSIKYDRGVGFFSSGWISIVSEGLLTFARNGGYARWVTSPVLSKTD